jgi:hypothetical protein
LPSILAINETNLLCFTKFRFVERKKFNESRKFCDADDENRTKFHEHPNCRDLNAAHAQSAMPRNILLAQEEDENMAFLVASFSLGLLSIIVTLMVGRKSQDLQKTGL